MAVEESPRRQARRRHLLREEPLGETLDRLARACRDETGAAAGGLALLAGGAPSASVQTDALATALDAAQYDAGEGPCLSAANDGKTYAMFDVHTDRRWPRFSAALGERTPVHSVLSFELASKESAALNLFADVAGAFDSESVLIGTIFAAHTSSTVALFEAEQRADHLHVALENSREIGAAIGVLMSYHKVTRDAAFELLRAASQQLNRKLRDLAGEVVETGALPTTEVPRSGAHTGAPPSGEEVNPLADY